MIRRTSLIYTLAIFNIVYVVMVSVLYFEFVFNILFYFGWGALLACFGYCLGLEHGESVKLPESANKAKEEK